jgi:hypothetical protein
MLPDPFRGANILENSYENRSSSGLPQRALCGPSGDVDRSGCPVASKPDIASPFYEVQSEKI